MEYYEPVAMYVMEQVTEPNKPRNIVKCTDNGLFYVKFDEVIQ